MNMKVLIIPSWYPTEENKILGIFFKEQAIALKKHGCQVMVLYPEIRTLRSYSSSWKQGVQIAEEDGLKVYRYKTYNPLPARVPFSNAFVYYSRLKKLFKEMVRKDGKPDIIHAHSVLWGGWAAAKIAEEENIPLVVTEHSSKLVRDLLKPYEKKEVAKTLNKADGIISVGPSLKKEMQKYTDKHVLEIPNIVDYKAFQNNRRKDSQKDRFRFLSLAFLTSNKGMDILIKSFAKGFKGDDVELVIGGDGQQMDELVELAKELGIEAQVQFLGRLDRQQVVAQMQNCDAFVLASKFETFGVVLIEALASGKPVVSTSSGGPESIVNDKNGFLVPVDDIEELSKAMQQLYHQYHEYNLAAIRKDCENRFSEEVIVGKIVEVYHSLL
ncbi:glycosyltransferase [Mesobacillus subterraneus]|uniref:glycosyltransferase n=1 Tax=Mesobacillus subterraneus TaxID=285983 RepID=UPI001CFC5B1B|nr:glycosyltransferase [Mesobacillus subterraneus]WLR55518.1 glycosyltransferase [Mesobacillus subterraneus]